MSGVLDDQAPVRRRAPRGARSGRVRDVDARTRASSASSAPRVVDLTERVYLQLRESIVLLNLPPGAPISELEVCRRLNVSRTPVRAAIARLEREGLIVVARAGLRSRLIVAPLTVDDMRQLFLIVGALDGLAAWLAAGREKRVRTALVKDLERINGELRQLAYEGQPLAVRRAEELDAQFHRAYHVAAAAPQLLAHLDALQARRKRYIHVYTDALVHTRNLRQSIQEHDAIIAALRVGDADKAERGAMFNYRQGVERFTRVLGVVGELGEWFSPP